MLITSTEKQETRSCVFTSHTFLCEMGVFCASDFFPLCRKRKLFQKSTKVVKNRVALCVCWCGGLGAMATKATHQDAGSGKQRGRAGQIYDYFSGGDAHGHGRFSATTV